MKNAEIKKGRTVTKKPRSKPRAKTSELQRVCVEYAHPEAQEVGLAGSFNEWNPQAKRLTCTEQGKWKVEVQLPPGRYEYLLVVDGQWMTDPAASESVPNPYGGTNSVLSVTEPALRRKTKAKTAPRSRAKVGSTL